MVIKVRVANILKVHPLSRRITRGGIAKVHDLLSCQAVIYTVSALPLLKIGDVIGIS